MTIEPPVQTGLGDNVEVKVSDRVFVIYESVTKTGVSTATELPIGPGLTGDMEILKRDGNPVYFNIKSTAAFTGDATILINYAGSDLSQINEFDLRLLRWDEVSGSWVSAHLNVDPESDTISGKSHDLGLFIIVAQKQVAQPPVEANQPPIANAGSDVPSLWAQMARP